MLLTGRTGSLSGKSCLFESSIDFGSIRILGQVKEGKFPVRICNPLSSPVQMRSSSKLGMLSVVKDPVVAVEGEQELLSDMMASEESPRKENDILQDLVEQEEVSSDKWGLLRENPYRNKEVFSRHRELGRYKNMQFSNRYR